MFSFYYQKMCKYKEKIVENNNIIISLNAINLNYKFICHLCKNTRNYILEKTKFGEISLSQSNVERKQKLKTFKKQETLPKNYQRNKTYSNGKRNSVILTKKIFINDLENGFKLEKTKNNFKNDLKWRNNPINLISIHNIIVRSLDFENKSAYLHKIKSKNKNKQLNYRQKLFFKQYSKRLSKKYLEINNFGINSSKRLLKQLSLRNQHNIKSEKEINSKKILRRGSTLLKFEEFAKSFLKNQSMSFKSSETNGIDLSVLKRKRFFKIPKENKKESQQTLLIRKGSAETKMDNEDEQINYEEIYFELISFIIEGNNKNFQNCYEKNRMYIDVDEELFDGNTLLILSAREGNFSITKFLCEEKAEVNLQNNQGNTALHYVIGKQFYAIADLLARYGAKEDIKNNKGLTPWDCSENNFD